MSKMMNSSVTNNFSNIAPNDRDWHENDKENGKGGEAHGDDEFERY